MFPTKSNVVMFTALW